MASRIIVTLLALVVGAVVLLAACQNPGPTVVMLSRTPLEPLGIIVTASRILVKMAMVRLPLRAFPAAFITTCGICHTVADAGTTGTIGPELSHIGTVAATRTGLSAEEYIRQSIEEPGAFIAPEYTPLMTAGLKDVLGGDFEDVVAYLLTLE